MILNSNKEKAKTILTKIRNLVLDLILYFVTAYMRKYPIHVTRAQGKTPNTLGITWSKQNYDKEFTTVTTHKHVQNYYNEKCTYNIITH